MWFPFLESSLIKMIFRHILESSHLKSRPPSSDMEKSSASLRSHDLILPCWAISSCFRTERVSVLLTVFVMIMSSIPTYIANWFKEKLYKKRRAKDWRFVTIMSSIPTCITNVFDTYKHHQWVYYIAYQHAHDERDLLGQG